MAAIRHDDLLLRLVKEVNDIKAALRRVVVNLPLYDIANENTPAQLTADQNNYPPGNYDILRLSSSQAVNISGILGGVKGRSLKLFNDGSYPITLLHGSLLSDAANRFRFSSGYNAVIPPQANTNVYYDSSNLRWIDGDRSSSGVVYCKLTKGAGETSLPINNWTRITGFTVVDDYYGMYNVASSKIIIKFSGTYIITQSVLMGINVGRRTLGLYLNGALENYSQLSYAYDNGDGYQVSSTLVTLITLDIDDELDFYCLSEGNSNGAEYPTWRLARLG